MNGIVLVAEWIGTKQAAGIYGHHAMEGTRSIGDHPVSFMESFKSKADSTFERTVRYHVRSFEGWIQGPPYNDHRSMETITPSELDRYFADFFSSVKTKNGEDFTKKSLLRRRATLQRYLKDKGYPESITNTEVFPLSSKAFRERLKKC